MNAAACTMMWIGLMRIELFWCEHNVIISFERGLKRTIQIQSSLNASSLNLILKGEGVLSPAVTYQRANGGSINGSAIFVGLYCVAEE